MKYKIYNFKILLIGSYLLIHYNKNLAIIDFDLSRKFDSRFNRKFCSSLNIYNSLICSFVLSENSFIDFSSRLPSSMISQISQETEICFKYDRLFKVWRTLSATVKSILWLPNIKISYLSICLLRKIKANTFQRGVSFQYLCDTIQSLFSDIAPIDQSEDHIN